MFSFCFSHFCSVFVWMKLRKCQFLSCFRFCCSELHFGYFWKAENDQQNKTFGLIRKQENLFVVLPKITFIFRSFENEIICINKNENWFLKFHFEFQSISKEWLLKMFFSFSNYFDWTFLFFYFSQKEIVILNWNKFEIIIWNLDLIDDWLMKWMKLPDW